VFDMSDIPNNATALVNNPYIRFLSVSKPRTKRKQTLRGLEEQTMSLLINFE